MVRLVLNILKYTVIGAAIPTVILYIGDFASIRINIPKRPQTTDLQIQQLISVPIKGGKTEYMLGDMQTQTCSNSIFPQLGYNPCWYVKRQSEQHINM